MSSANPDVMLSLRALTKSYGDLRAVNDLSFDVVRGEVFGLLGPNGAGKTTTINMICGLLKSEAGSIEIDGRPVSAAHRQHKQIGLCPQDVVIWETLTCGEQLEFMGRLYDVDRAAARRRARELLEILGLMDRRDTLARALSGGMKRRLNIALALVHEPAILILDEPQAGLDPQSRILVREYVRSLADRTTVILTTHDMDEADRLSDRIAIIDHGRLLVLDTSDNLKNRVGPGEILEVKVPDVAQEQLHRLRESLPPVIHHLAFEQGTLRLVGADILNLLPSLLETFRHHNITIEEMTIRQRTLEDVFITLTGRGLRE
ncbi:MAG: ABC transporter ATP-binding protein [Gemmatimonadota bacterium]|nr:ABC transporter ATP-binding protein [Gemmatimonadota bacterium]